MDDKCVENYQTVTKVTEEVNALQYVGHALKTVLTCKRNSAANLVEICGISVYMDWLQWRENLYKYTTNIAPDKKPDIIFIPAYDRIAPLGFKIQHIIRSLKKQYVVITNALCLRGPVAPLAFPGDSVIAVGRKGEKVHGSALDFVLPDTTDSNIMGKDKNHEKAMTESGEVKLALPGTSSGEIERNENNSKEDCGQIGDVKTNDAKSDSSHRPWESGLQTAGIAAIVLLRAQQLGMCRI